MVCEIIFEKEDGCDGIRPCLYEISRDPASDACGQG